MTGIGGLRAIDTEAGSSAVAESEVDAVGMAAVGEVVEPELP